MNVDWVNTPGGYYAISYWICSCLIIHFSEKRSKDMRRNLLISIFMGLSLFVLMQITHGMSHFLFIPFMTLFIMIIWANIYFICGCDMPTSINFTAQAFLMGELMTSLEWLIWYHAVAWKILPVNAVTQYGTFVIVYGLISYIYYRMEHRRKEIYGHITIAWNEIWGAVTITLAAFIASNLSYLVRDTVGTEIVLSQILLVRALVDLGGVSMLYAYHSQIGALGARFEMERLQDMLAMQRTNYEMIEQSVNTINQKYHDLKYQIALLKSEVGNADSMKYLDRMEQDIKAYEAQNKTGNKVLDTILTGKTLYCQGNWIELTSVADGAALNFMDPMDISTMFGNMLDNAIESVEKIDKKERRLIHLAVTRQKGFLRIRQENCCGENPEFENGLPKTTKENKKYHGFGLKSIQSTVKKYGGSTTVHMENGWFELRILIPVPREEKN